MVFADWRLGWGSICWCCCVGTIFECGSRWMWTKLRQSFTAGSSARSLLAACWTGTGSWGWTVGTLITTIKSATVSTAVMLIMWSDGFDHCFVCHLFIGIYSRTFIVIYWQIGLHYYQISLDPHDFTKILIVFYFCLLEKWQGYLLAWPNLWDQSWTRNSKRQ